MAELFSAETEVRVPQDIKTVAKENRVKIVGNYAELAGVNPEKVVITPEHIKNLGEDTAVAVVENRKNRRATQVVQILIYAPEKFAEDGEKREIVLEIGNSREEPYVPEVRDGEMIQDDRETNKISMAEKMFIREITKTLPTEPLSQEQLIELAREQVRKALDFQMRREITSLGVSLEMTHVTSEIAAGIASRAKLDYKNIDNANLTAGRLSVESADGFIKDGIIDEESYWKKVNALERFVTGRELAGKVEYREDEEGNVEINNASIRRPDTGEDLRDGNSVVKKFLEKRLPSKLAQRIRRFDKLHLEESGEDRNCWLEKQNVDALWRDLYQESLQDWFFENRNSFQNQFRREILPDKSPFSIPSELSISLRNLSLNSRRTNNPEALSFKALKEDERKLTVNFDFQGTDFQITLDPEQEKIQITNAQSEVERSVLLQALFSSNPEISKEDLRVYERRAVYTGLEKLRQGKLMIKENDLLLTDMDLEKKPNIALSEDILFIQNGLVSRFRPVDGKWHKQDGEKWRIVQGDEASDYLTEFAKSESVLPEDNETVSEFASLDLKLDVVKVELDEEINLINSNAIFSKVSGEVNRLLTEEERRDIRATDYVEDVTAKDILELSEEERERYKNILALRKIEKIREKLKLN